MEKERWASPGAMPRSPRTPPDRESVFAGPAEAGLQHAVKPTSESDALPHHTIRNSSEVARALFNWLQQYDLLNFTRECGS